MKIDNKQSVQRSLLIFILILSGSFAMLLIAFIFQVHLGKVMVTSLSLIFLSLWKISSLKMIRIDFSGEIVSIKYSHPFISGPKVSLELPLAKIESCNVDKGFLNYFLCVNVKGKKIKSFYYHLGTLSSEEFRLLSVFITNINRLSKDIDSSFL
ncbi:hypothetical protein J2X97_002015 [Epilithonimonas hungarica]|uniref:hypothetical protein n=1 Tax=Epilithonimonas hungarica TaxID=454006 RepID=UPI002782D16D|nr:hypothetical protein [Epilithonimonas hungarica]MDP9956378.1 hypothetical protein [Epilithonimonas hungarica]